MKIEAKHLKYKNWMTLVTVGEKQFGLQTLSDGVRLHEGSYSPRKSSLGRRSSGGSFTVTNTHDFASREEALAFYQA